MRTLTIMYEMLRMVILEQVLLILLVITIGWLIVKKIQEKK